MYDTLITYLNNYGTTPLSDDDIDLIKSIFVPKKFRKRQYFLQEGEVCKYTAFIVKGAMRQYSVDDKGEEHILGLFMENWWASDRESFIRQTPSVYFIDAWEETDALVISSTDSLHLLSQIPAMRQITGKMDENAAIAAQKRLNAAISLSAEQRYNNLEKTNPQFLQRFPQHIIASYLGISRETLSRIRSNAIKK